MKKIRCVIVLLSVFLLAGCSTKDVQEVNEVEQAEKVNETQETESEQPPKEVVEVPVINQGQVIDSVYSNGYFGLEFILPEGWTVLTLDEVDQVMNAGKEIVEEVDEDIGSELSEAQVLSLLGTFKYPFNEQVPFNPSMLVNGEKIDPSTGIADGKAFLEASKEILLEMDIPYTFEDQITTVKIDGVTYGTMKATIVSGETIISQTYYAAIIKGYVINIVSTYVLEEDAEILKKVLGLSSVGQ